MTRTTRDCATMLSLISRPDAREAFAAPPQEVDYAAGLGAGVAGLKVGFIARYGDTWQHPDVVARVAEAVKALETQGAVVEPIAPPPITAEAGRVWVIHWYSALQRLLQLYPAERHGEFDPALLEQARTGEKFTVQTLVDAMVERREITTAWNLLFTRYDLIVSPTLNTPAFPVGRMSPPGPDGAPFPFWTNTALWNLTRHPTISTPCGLTADGLPVGLQISAAHYRDDMVLAASEALEQALGASFPALPV
jgi:aspartyl-tRNA(Asn)/glutamyl-tRNA(Gln) amidotransferase subunit A